MTAYEIGVDVSKWQAPERMNWRKLRDEAGVRFVIARHCYGVLVDATFWRQRHCNRALSYFSRDSIRRHRYYRRRVYNAHIHKQRNFHGVAWHTLQKLLTGLWRG